MQLPPVQMTVTRDMISLVFWEGLFGFIKSAHHVLLGPCDILLPLATVLLRESLHCRMKN